MYDMTQNPVQTPSAHCFGPKGFTKWKIKKKNLMLKGEQSLHFGKKFWKMYWVTFLLWLFAAIFRKFSKVFWLKIEKSILPKMSYFSYHIRWHFLCYGHSLTYSAARVQWDFLFEDILAPKKIGVVWSNPIFKNCLNKRCYGSS